MVLYPYNLGKWNFGICNYWPVVCQGAGQIDSNTRHHQQEYQILCEKTPILIYIKSIMVVCYAFVAKTVDSEWHLFEFDIFHWINPSSTMLLPPLEITHTRYFKVFPSVWRSMTFMELTHWRFLSLESNSPWLYPVGGRVLILHFSLYEKIPLTVDGRSCPVSPHT